MKAQKIQAYRLSELPSVEAKKHKRKKWFAYMTIIGKKSRYVCVEYTWGKTKISIKKRYLRPEDIITTLATYLKEK